LLIPTSSNFIIKLKFIDHFRIGRSFSASAAPAFYFRTLIARRMMEGYVMDHVPGEFGGNPGCGRRQQDRNRQGYAAHEGEPARERAWMIQRGSQSKDEQCAPRARFSEAVSCETVL
jgi:hypothetical protein